MGDELPRRRLQRGPYHVHFGSGLPYPSHYKGSIRKGWARNGAITKDTTYYGLETVLDHYEHDKSPVGPMFWAHYSYLGLDPKGLTDQYADYWKLNQNHALIQYKYAVDNPHNYKGYGKNLWGLTSSYSINGYAGHRPDEDLGVISQPPHYPPCPTPPMRAWSSCGICTPNRIA